MLGILCLVIVLVVRYSSGSAGLDLTYSQHTATDALLHEMVSLKEPTHVCCAHQCLLQNSECEGFQVDNVSSSCLLFEKICFATGALDTFHGRKDALQQPITTLLAQGKKAVMSTEINSGTHASIGTDGVYPTTHFPGAAFHTLCDEYAPWWRVDLLDPFCVTAVYFLNRGYESTVIWQRAKNIVVTVSPLEENIMDTGDNRCGYIDGVAQQLHNLVTCEMPMVGRFVQLQMLDTACFHLYEVEVHGH